MADLDLPASPLNEGTSWPGLQHVGSWEKQKALAPTGVSSRADRPSRDAEAQAAQAEAHAAAEATSGNFPASRETAGPPAPGCSSPGTPESHQGEPLCGDQNQASLKEAPMLQILALANTQIKALACKRGVAYLQAHHLRVRRAHLLEAPRRHRRLRLLLT